MAFFPHLHLLFICDCCFTDVSAITLSLLLQKVEANRLSKDLCCGASPLPPVCVRKAVLSIFPVSSCIFSALPSYRLNSMPSAFQFQLSLSSLSCLKKTSPYFSIALQPSPSLPTQPTFLELPTLCLSHIPLLPHPTDTLHCTFEAASIIDSTPTISPDLFTEVPSDLPYLFIQTTHFTLTYLDISAACSKADLSPSLACITMLS